MLAEIDSFASAKETDSIKSAIQSEHQQKMAAETARREEVLLYIYWYCCLSVVISDGVAGEGA
jgi:hypothetical protein